MDAVIDFSIYKKQGQFELNLSPMSFSAKGITAIFGSSGSGKTTLLRCLAGFDDFTGHIHFKNKTWKSAGVLIKTHQRPLGFVFQEPNLFTHLNVQDNLKFGLSRVSERERKLTWPTVIELLKLEPLLSRAILSLSGGEKQRVAIGRALLTSPELLIMDEPLSAVDFQSKNEILNHLKKINSELKVPIIYVSHFLDEILKIADDLLIIEKGRMIKKGKLSEVLTSTDFGLSQFEMQSTLLIGRFLHHEFDFGIDCVECEGQKIYLPHSKSLEAEVRIKVDAKDVSIIRQKPLDSSILNILKVEIYEIKNRDDFQVLLKLKMGHQFLFSRITKKSLLKLNLAVGDIVFAQIKTMGLCS